MPQRNGKRHQCRPLLRDFGRGDVLTNGFFLQLTAFLPKVYRLATVDFNIDISINPWDPGERIRPFESESIRI